MRVLTEHGGVTSGEGADRARRDQPICRSVGPRLEWWSLTRWFVHAVDELYRKTRALPLSTMRNHTRSGGGTHLDSHVDELGAIVESECPYLHRRRFYPLTFGAAY